MSKKKKMNMRRIRLKAIAVTLAILITAALFVWMCYWLKGHVTQIMIIAYVSGWAMALLTALAYSLVVDYLHLKSYYDRGEVPPFD